MTEAKESLIRDQALLMMNRNYGNLYMINKILKRFMRCINGKYKQSEHIES